MNAGLETGLSSRERAIMVAVRGSPGLVRSELARRLGLDKSTTNRMVQGLVDRRYLVEESDSSARKGRGGIPLGIHPRGPRAIGAEMTGAEIHCACVNLAGERLAEAGMAVSPSMSADELLDAIKSTVSRTLIGTDCPKAGILGIGFGHSAVMNTETGTSFTSSKFPNWRNVGIARFLRDSFQLPVAVEDSARTKCLAEAVYGVARGYRDFIYVNCGDGVGLGVWTGGRLYRGAQGLGCEIGHMIVDPDGPLCGCGSKGCLEAIASSRAITRQVTEGIRQGVRSSIADGIQQERLSELEVSTAAVYTAAMKSDRLATSLVNSAKRTLGMAIGNVCNLFGPSLVVLGGDMAKFPTVWQGIESEIRHAAMPLIGEKLKVRFSELDETAGVLGAAELVVERSLYPQGTVPR